MVRSLLNLCSYGRSLLSFDGDYLKHDCCRLTSRDAIDCVENGDLILDSQHEIFRINITQTRPEIHGPAFVEVSIIFFDNLDQIRSLNFCYGHLPLEFMVNLIVLKAWFGESIIKYTGECLSAFREGFFFFCPSFVISLLHEMTCSSPARPRKKEEYC